MHFEMDLKFKIEIYAKSVAGGDVLCICSV